MFNSDLDVMARIGFPKTAERIRKALDKSCVASGRTAGICGDYWIIRFDDQDRHDEVFTDERAAWERFEDVGLSWSCHLFKRIASR